MLFKKMKNKHILFLAVAFNIFYPFFQKKGWASEAAKVVPATPSAIYYDIAILNIEKLLYESKSAKGIQTQLEGHWLKLQEEMKQNEESFSALEKVLVEQQKILKPDEFALKRKELDTKVAEGHQQVAQKREEIESAFGQAMEKVQKTILLLVHNMAIKNKYKLVVTRNCVIFREDALEITEEILKELDQKLPVVELKFS